jgi:hypothetical protein
MALLLALALALAVAPGAAPAQDSLQAHAAGRDGFVVGLVTTSDPDNFLRAWGGPLSSLPITERAVRGQPLSSIVFMQGCRAGADGKCNVTGHFTYLLPDGSVYAEMDAVLWDIEPNAGGNMVYSPFGPILSVDPPDPMGTWTLRVRVTDNVRGLSLMSETPITVDTPPTAAAVN